MCIHKQPYLASRHHCILVKLPQADPYVLPVPHPTFRNVLKSRRPPQPQLPSAENPTESRQNDRTDYRSGANVQGTVVRCRLRRLVASNTPSLNRTCHRDIRRVYSSKRFDLKLFRLSIYLSESNCRDMFRMGLRIGAT